ncbi:MAG: ATP-binding protein [Leptolyngbyaceae bacterium]|nr:ATP-binding protein [Leptolyngbyaceae bacterium]
MVAFNVHFYSVVADAEHLLTAIALMSAAIALWWGWGQRRRAALGQDAIAGERLYRAILDALPDLIIRMKRDGTYVDVRPARQFRTMASAKVGANVRDVLPPPIAQQRIEMAERAIQTRRPQTYDFQLCVDGENQWQEACIVDLSHDEVIILIRDITERKNALEQLRRQEAQQRAILTAIPDLIFRLRSDGVFLGYVRTDTFSDMLPTDFEPIGKHITDSLSSEHAHRHLEAMHQALSTQQLVVYEQEFVVNGQRQYEEVRVVASGDDEVLFIIRDVSDRKNSELAHDEMERQLQRHLNRVLLLEQITNEIRGSLDLQRIFQVTVDQIGRLFQVNRCLLHLYVDGNDAERPSIPFVAEYLDEAWPSILQMAIPLEENAHAQRLIAQDRAIASNNVYDDPLLESVHDLCHTIELKSMLVCRTSYQDTPNGAIVLHQCDRYRMWTEDEIVLLEAVAAQVGIALYHAHLLEQAIRQQAELEAKNRDLERATREAEAANRSKSRFLATMNHELRTPLNIILGFAQVLQSATDLPDDYRNDVRLILESGEHLLTLINNLLTLAKLEAGMIPLDERSFELNGFIDSIELMFAQKIQQKELSFTIDRWIDSPLWVTADEGKIRQILMHLLDNAIKFTDYGVIRLTVAIAHCNIHPQSFRSPQRFSDPSLCSVHQANIRFEISDTGCGIDASALKKVFNAMAEREAGKKKSSEGAGLGLTLSQTISQFIGATLSVTSEVGKGSCFSIDIPVLVEGKADITDENAPSTMHFVQSSPYLVSPTQLPDLSSPKITSRLFPEDLRSFSSEWLERLYDASVRCDDSGAQHLVNEIEDDEEAIAPKIRQLIDLFQFEELVQLIDQAKQIDPPQIDPGTDVDPANPSQSSSDHSSR